MGMAAILVMWLRLFEQTSPSHEDSIWNLASISPKVSEEKMFRVWTTDGRMTEAYLSFKLTNEPSAQLN